MEKVLGAVTVGQSPRDDVMADIGHLFTGYTIVQAGALDFVTDFAALAPEAGDYVLVSRLRDGGSVTFSERKALPHLQGAIDRVCAEGAGAIMMLCTGEFPESIRSTVPLIYPCRLLAGVVGAVARDRHIAVLTPDELQIPQIKKRWSQISANVDVYPASPYGAKGPQEAAARAIRKTAAEYVVLDCIGFSVAMKKSIQDLCGKPVILPRTLLAQVAQELL